MPLPLPHERLKQLASLQSRQRAELLTIAFTDLVGSTRLKQELGDATAVRLMQEHHAQVRRLLAEFPSGLEVNTQGDSFFLAFSRPSDAVRFALRLQAHLREWNRHRPWKLTDRIGIHVGEVILETQHASEAVHDLNGLEVDKCARVMSLAEGDRILLTRPAVEMARVALRGDELDRSTPIRWICHGAYQLKGVADPVEIFEVSTLPAEDLPPPPDSEKARRLEAEESPPRDRRVARRTQLIGAVLTGLIGILLAVLGGPLTHLSYDLAYLFRSPDTPTNAVLVTLDPYSYDELKQRPEERWPRALHAQILERLASYQPQAIVLDVVFSEPGIQGEAPDRALVEAIRRYGRVAVAAAAVPRKHGGTAGFHVSPPFPSLRDVTQWGPAVFAEDRFVREMVPAIEGYPSLPGIVAQMVSSNGPSLPARRTWLNYYGPPGSLVEYPYATVLRGAVSAEHFSNRVVFIGANYPGPFPAGGVDRQRTGFDSFRTPYSRWEGGRESAGVEVVATQFLNLLRGDGLYRLPAAAESAILMASGFIATLFLARFRPLVAGGIAGITAILVALGGMSMVWPTHVWFPWMIITAVQIPHALIWCAFARLEPPPIHRRASTHPEPSPGSRLAPPDTQSVTHAQAAGDAAPPPAPAFAPEPAPTPPSAIDNYTLLREIGRGGYGEVWLARDAIGQLRAVKIVRREAFSNARPFEREFEGIRLFTPYSLRHPGLIPILHVGKVEAAGFFYYVMEAADDQDTGDRIEPTTYRPRTVESEVRRFGPLPAGTVLSLGIALGEALGFLHHQKLVHRDVKPANVLFVSGQPRLGDVGLVADLERRDSPVSQVGTHGYLPPEGPGTVAADLYALGKLLYVAVTGRVAREFPELPDGFDRRPDMETLIPLNQVLLRACDPDPDRRFPSMSELVAALKRIPPPDPAPEPPGGHPASAKPGPL